MGASRTTEAAKFPAGYCFWSMTSRANALVGTIAGVVGIAAAVFFAPDDPSPDKTQAKLDAELLSRQHVTGFVSLGRQDGSTSYFLDHATGEHMTRRPSGPPRAGDRIHVRPSVPQFTLRGNRLDTDGDQTLSLRQIVPGECFEISDEVKVMRNLYWAPVRTLGPCADLDTKVADGSP